MEWTELQKLVIEQRKKLFKYKDKQVRPLLVAYADLLKKMQLEITQYYLEVNVDDRWNWQTAQTKKQKLESIFYQIEMDLQDLSKTAHAALEVAMTSTITVEYAFASFVTAKAIDGYILLPPVIPRAAIREVLEHPWSGDHFSNRLWGNTANFKTTLRRTIISSMVNGESVQKTTKKLKDAFETEAYKAERLVRSEIIAAGNRANKKYYNSYHERFKDLDLLEGVRISETLDRRTCGTCRSLDGKIVSVDEMDSIKDIEHPNCRRCLLPVVKGFSRNIQRAARTNEGEYVRTNAKNFDEYAKEFGIPSAYEVKKEQSRERYEKIKKEREQIKRREEKEKDKKKSTKGGDDN
ncbi:minor capsid protein [Bacillus sp. CGMCC 1.16541]|uniref:minor capsid protein n=1 Tax=Bacillus sp. CGMCC 1.16541 TaxID=2185143 RepID=UPI000D72BB0D|nr:minor capsid protein [Bacillus sp. CGMCC 1.16541]